jgi:hypothetical protein
MAVGVRSRSPQPTALGANVCFVQGLLVHARMRFPGGFTVSGGAELGWRFRLLAGIKASPAGVRSRGPLGSPFS